MASKTTTETVRATTSPAKSGGIPYLVRELTRQVLGMTGLPIDVPMNYRLPPTGETEKFVPGIARLGFEGSAWKVEIETRQGPFGQEHRINSLRGRIHFSERQMATDWLFGFWEGSGPVSWDYIPDDTWAPNAGGRLVIVVQGNALTRLLMNMAYRNADIPLHRRRWNDPTSPVPATEEEWAIPMPVFVPPPAQEVQLFDYEGNPLDPLEVFRPQAAGDDDFDGFEGIEEEF